GWAVAISVLARRLRGIYELRSLSAYTTHPADRRQSYSMGVVTRYANAKPSPESWQTTVLGAFRKLIIGAGTEPLPGPVFGVASFEELQTVLQEFRDFASEWAKLKRRDHAGERLLIRQLDERSRLRIAGYIPDRRTGRLVPRFDTETGSFREMLYS